MQIRKQVDGNDYYTNYFDRRGNLVRSVEESTNNTVEEYVYDVTNRMVKGTNEKGEESHYVYNGLGYRISNEQIIEKTNPDYHGIGATLVQTNS